MNKIKKIIGRQIIDSRGNPTCEADVILENGIVGRGAVPSGASTGKLEALELRDNNVENYDGKSVLNAISNINLEISSKIDPNYEFTQESFDHFLIDLDGIDIGVSFKISSINLDPEVVPTIQGRDFVIANIQAPSGLKSMEEETSEETSDDPDTEAKEETDTDKT